MTLDQFLVENKDVILKRCQETIRKRTTPLLRDEEVEQRLPIFYDQVVDTLRKLEDQGAVVVPAPSLVPSPPTLIGEGAGRHGRELQRLGFSLGQVVHLYGTICDSVTSLAQAKGFAIASAEFNLFNRCLDDAIGQAVAEFEQERDEDVSSREIKHLGALAHELRNTLTGAMAALSMIKKGVVGVAGRTGGVLDRSLMRMRDLIDRSLTEVRLRSEVEPRREHVDLDLLVEQVELTMAPQAETRDVRIELDVQPEVEVEADGQMLMSAIANLVQNGLRFTRPGGAVCVRARARDERLTLEVEDECGGLSPEALESLRHPGLQESTDPQGMGLGVWIAHKAIAAHGGQIEVRNIPGHGCIFVIDMPLRMGSGEGLEQPAHTH